MPYDHDELERADADALTAALYAAGRKSAALWKRGICDHGWFQGPMPGEPGPSKCLHCGKDFLSTDALLAERDSLR